MISSSTNNPQQTGSEILIRGTVQGVGFRPFVYNLASRLGITGSVSNTSDGVLIRAFAREERLDSFYRQLLEQPPPLARIVGSSRTPLFYEPEEGSGFQILASEAGLSARTAIPPDIALCGDCLRELTDPGDHRFRYPFINCTNCGPRYTIVETIPYDRPKTSMKVFPMCRECETEYGDPANRRFHAQPNACPRCGPSLLLRDRTGLPVTSADPVAETVTALAAGKIVAIRGLGGYHLAADALSETAVATLRRRKGRPDKPLAIMVADLASVREFCVLDEHLAKLLLSPAHPIVLLPRKVDSALAANLAPGLDEIGLMLPYTPLHHLLFAESGCPSALVMTSGNASGAPICTDNEDAILRLAGIADMFVCHNRDIVARVDDSVCRPVAGTTQFLRRARGFAPAPQTVGYHLPAILGCGAGLKNTFALARDDQVFVSQHIGDLFNLESYEFYRESVEHLKRLTQIEPEAVVRDLHPEYLSSRYAEETGLPLYSVQHHHAHAVAVMAEHGLTQPCLAVVLDGTGYGSDGTIWGGEILAVELTDFKRLAHLEQFKLPGGDVATAEPWRVALSLLWQAHGALPSDLPPSLTAVPEESRRVIAHMLKTNLNAPATSSCGRLFDGIASLIGLRQRVTYEGQAAIELEVLAKRIATTTWYNQIPSFSALQNEAILCEKGEKWEICSTEFVKLALAALASGAGNETIALQFHLLLISSITELLNRLSQPTGIRDVLLTGGCLQNSLLLEGLTHTLAAAGFSVYTGGAIPVNDGGISFGQTIIGGLHHVSRHSHAGYQGCR